MDDNEKLCEVEPRLRLRRFPPPAGLEPGTGRSTPHIFIKDLGLHEKIPSECLNNTI